jgi:hypothetical protein
MAGSVPNAALMTVAKYTRDALMLSKTTGSVGALLDHYSKLDRLFYRVKA